MKVADLDDPVSMPALLTPREPAGVPRLMQVFSWLLALVYAIGVLTTLRGVNPAADDGECATALLSSSSGSRNAMGGQAVGE